MSDPSGHDRMQIPLHRRIAEDLTRQVNEGTLRPGQKLPSERHIAQEHRASRATVRTALGHLEQAGIINRRDRRSAVVTVKRSVTPSVRLACSSARLLRVFRELGDMHLLPARHQVQFVDLQQPGALSQMAAQPTAGADIIICEFEYLRCFQSQEGFCFPLSAAEFGEAQIAPVMSDLFKQDRTYTAVPLGFSPMILYRNRLRMGEHALTSGSASPLPWPQLQETLAKVTTQGQYGLQLRPTFAHLAALMASRGLSLYQSDGRINAKDAPIFEKTVRMMHDFLHVTKISPILAKAEQINLFAQQRCAVAMDGFDMYPTYRQSVGHALEIDVLPQSNACSSVTTGFAAVVLPDAGQPQPAIDLVRNLLNTPTQKALYQLSGALPVRSDLLQLDAIQSLDIPAKLAHQILKELYRCRHLNLPGRSEHKSQVENLFLELWLGLDTIDNLCHRFQQL